MKINEVICIEEKPRKKSPMCVILLNRGVHWKGGDSDGGGDGTVTRAENSGLVAVKWDNGNFGFYRFLFPLLSGIL